MSEIFINVELPKTWLWAKSKEIGFVINGDRGKNYPSRQHYISSGVPFLSAGNLDEGKIDKTSLNFISEEKYNALNNGKLKKGDIIYCLRGTLGKCAAFDMDEKAAIASSLVILRPSEQISKKYLLYFLQSPFGIKLIKHFDNGTAQPNLSGASFSNYDFPIAPFPEQHRIVAKVEELFSSLDKGIESLKTAQQQLKVYRQAVLKWAFEGKLTNKDVKDGELPEGWKRMTLGNIANRNSQKALPSEMPEAKFIGMDCIEPNTLKPFKFYEFKDFKSAGNVFKRNQVLYGRMRPYLNKVYKAEIDGTCSGEFIILNCLNDFNPDLLKYILHHRDFVRFANHKTSGDRPRISFEEIADYPVNVCKPAEQQLIVSEIESRLSVCDKIEESISTSLQQAEALRQSILKKAFEGKLAEQNPNDEPASKLLERIKAEREKNKPVKKIKTKKQKIANG